VIVIDANILIYAHVQSFAQSKSARDWLDQQLNGSTRVGLPWVSLMAFLRLVTNPRVFERPEPMTDAWRQVRAWLTCEAAWIPQPTDRHVDFLDTLLALPGVHANLVPDAHLAALALEHGLTLCSTDGDFARFPSLRYLNPLAP
jgi:toxin-antitoxin system PIN domain toxin